MWDYIPLIPTAPSKNKCGKEIVEDLTNNSKNRTRLQIITEEKRNTAANNAYMRACETSCPRRNMRLKYTVYGV